MSQIRIAAALKKLTAAYPERKVERATLEVYVEELGDLPDWLLEAAVDEVIRQSAWFPKISELRQAAARLANTRSFESLPRRLVNALSAEAQALEDAFYHEQRLDPAAWAALAQAFEAAGRPHRAGFAREKLRRLEWIAAARGDAGRLPRLAAIRRMADRFRPAGGRPPWRGHARRSWLGTERRRLRRSRPRCRARAVGRLPGPSRA